MGETDWGKLGTVPMSRAMLIKSFIQFSVDGQGSIPSLRPNYAGCNEDTLAPSSWFLTHSGFV